MPQKTAQHCKALQTPPWPAGALGAAPPAPPGPSQSPGVQARKLAENLSPAGGRRRGKGPEACTRRSEPANPTNPGCEGEKRPRLYLLPRAPEVNASFVGCPSTLRKRKSAWTRGSVSGLCWSAKTPTSMATLSASLFRGTAVPAAMGWDVTALKSWWYWGDPERCQSLFLEAHSDALGPRLSRSSPKSSSAGGRS